MVTAVFWCTSTSVWALRGIAFHKTLKQGRGVIALPAARKCSMWTDSLVSAHKPFLTTPLPANLTVVLSTSDAVAYKPPADRADASVASVFHEDVLGILGRHGADLTWCLIQRLCVWQARTYEYTHEYIHP